MNDFIIWNNKNKLLYRIELLNKNMFKDIQKNNNLKHKYINHIEIINNNAINFLIPKLFHNTNLNVCHSIQTGFTICFDEFLCFDIANLERIQNSIRMLNICICL